MGLFWPARNHTVAVWSLHPSGHAPVRVVVPTTQIFLQENDYFDTPRFNPWSQRAIYEYTRHDVPNSFQLSKPLFQFLLAQVDKYGGASAATLQRLRYLREGVFLKAWTPEAAAREALTARQSLESGSLNDHQALANFARDMQR